MVGAGGVTDAGAREVFEAAESHGPEAGAADVTVVVVTCGVTDVFRRMVAVNAMRAPLYNRLRL